MNNRMLVSVQAAVRLEHGCDEEGFNQPELNEKFNDWCNTNKVDLHSSNVIYDHDIDDEPVICPILGIPDKSCLVELSTKE